MWLFIGFWGGIPWHFAEKFGSSLDFGVNYDLLRKQNWAFLSILGYNTTFCVKKKKNCHFIGFRTITWHFAFKMVTFLWILGYNMIFCIKNNRISFGFCGVIWPFLGAICPTIIVNASSCKWPSVHKDIDQMWP